MATAARDAPWPTKMGRRHMAAVVITLLIAAAMIAGTWREELLTIFDNKERIAPQPSLLWAFFGQILILAVAVLLMGGTLADMKADYQKRRDAIRAASTPPPIPTTTTNQSEQAPTPKQLTVAAYDARQFKFDSRIGDLPDAPEVWISTQRTHPDRVELIDGAVIYSDGSASQYSIALLHADDFWAFGDAEHVTRRTNKRSVTINTALNRPAIRQLVAAHDYVLGVGLASSNSGSGEYNDSVSIARGYNLTLAVLQLRLKDIDRLRPVSFGHATVAPALPALEPRQRAVMLVGVNASRSVILDDVMTATARTVQLEGVDFRTYSSGGRRFIQVGRRLDRAKGYMRPGEVGAIVLREGDDPIILPAVGEGK